MELWKDEINRVKAKMEAGIKKEDICDECEIRQGNVKFCFRCPAKEKADADE